MAIDVLEGRDVQTFLGHTSIYVQGYREIATISFTVE